MRSVWVGFVAVVLAVAAPLGAQTVTGRVLDAATGQPVPATRVEIVSQSSGRAAGRVETDADGRFTLAARSPGDYRLRAERIGYQYVASPLIRLASGQTFEFDLDLRPASMQLDGVVVTTRATPPFRDERARNFYLRTSNPGGRFILPEQVDARRPASAMTLMRSLPGTFTVSAGQRTPLMKSTGAAAGPSPLCVPTIYINGVFRNAIMFLNERPTPFEYLASIDEMVDPDELWAIEVYPTPDEAPGELPPRLDPFCGVVAIWTKQA